MKFCLSCGVQLQDTATICPNCGTPTQATAPAPAPAYAQAPAPAYAPAPGYAPGYPQGYAPFVPVKPQKVNRGLLKLIIFSIITFGIYPLVFFSSISNSVNLICSRFDGKRTMHYCLLYFLIAPLTLGIANYVWFHRISNRIGDEARRRGLPVTFSASTYWLWYFLGSLIVVGPFIYLYKLCKSMNMLCGHYNVAG